MGIFKPVGTIIMYTVSIAKYVQKVGWIAHHRCHVPSGQELALCLPVQTHQPINTAELQGVLYPVQPYDTSDFQHLTSIHVPI